MAASQNTQAQLVATTVNAAEKLLRPFPAVAFPFHILLSVLIGQENGELPVLQPKVKVEILAARFNPHEPAVMRHLLQMY